MLVGAYNTLFGYLAFIIAYIAFEEYVHYTILIVFAHLIAVTNSFITQRYFVFRSRAPWLGEFLRFHVSYAALLPVGVGLFALLHELVGLSILITQAYSLFIMIVVSYLTSRYFTFLKKN